MHAVVLGVEASARGTSQRDVHDRELALGYADRVIGLKGGRIVLDAATDGMAPADLDHLYAA